MLHTQGSLLLLHLLTMVIRAEQYTLDVWPKRSMPEKGAKVIGLQKDSVIGLEAEFSETLRLSTIKWAKDT